MKTKLLGVVAPCVLASTMPASAVTYEFFGTFEVALSDGTNTIPAGTPFSGIFSYSFPQQGPACLPPACVQTSAEYTFNSFSITVAGQTVSAIGPHSLTLYNNDPIEGDSLMTGTNRGANNPASSGSIDGITPNWIALTLEDAFNPTATAFSNLNLPRKLKLADFTFPAVQFNTGPFGTETRSQLNS